VTDAQKAALLQKAFLLDARRLGLKFLVEEDHIHLRADDKMTFEEFWSHIRTLRMKYGFSGTSDFRTPYRNKQVGGHKRSRHMLGLSIDVVLDPPQYQPFSLVYYED
jgi:uncharacterized protein YcbK (DUF882 family)